jgi:hypothetical protein
MSTSPHRHSLALEATTAERRPSSQGAASPPKFKVSPKSTDRAPSPHNHPPTDGSNDRMTRKSPSRSSTAYSDSAKHQTTSEEQENGKAVVVDGSKTHEEALRALEVYAAFQVAVLREITDDMTFKSFQG